MIASEHHNAEHTVSVVDRHRVRCFVAILIIGNHHRDIELLQSLAWECDADVPTKIMTYACKGKKSKSESAFHAYHTIDGRFHRGPNLQSNAPCMLDHPSHLFRRDVLGSNDKIPLVLATLIVHNNEELATRKCCEGILYCVKRKCFTFERRCSLNGVRRVDMFSCEAV